MPSKHHQHLQTEINRLKALQDDQLNELKTSAITTVEYFEPANIIKRTLKKIAGPNDIKQNLINISVGIATSLIAKKINKKNALSGNSHLLTSGLELLSTGLMLYGKMKESKATTDTTLSNDDSKKEAE